MITSVSSHDVISALSFVLMNVCTAEELSKLIIPAFELMEPTWANCLDRNQVINRVLHLRYILMVKFSNLI